MALESAAKRRVAVVARDQSTLKRARGNLLEYFPSMPRQDLETILSHGFKKGSGRVGRTTKLADDERTRKVVQAHIRHTHTRYDALLRSEARSKDPLKSERNHLRARNSVWPRVKSITQQWQAQRSQQSPSPRSSRWTISRSMHATLVLDTDEE